MVYFRVGDILKDLEEDKNSLEKKKPHNYLKKVIMRLYIIWL